MGITAKLFIKSNLSTMNKVQIKALLDQTDNPGAIHTYKEIMVINNENRTFTQTEKEQIELLINRLKEGGKNVAESRN